jgi:hypothetical protein
MRLSPSLAHGGDHERDSDWLCGLVNVSNHSAVSTHTSDKEELSTAYLRPITIPSLDTSRALPYDPALTIAFNNRARLYSADDARQLGERRLIALAGEEGTVNIVDIDDEQDPGTWWKAHGNGVFDLEWTTNDTRLVRVRR